MYDQYVLGPHVEVVVVVVSVGSIVVQLVSAAPFLAPSRDDLGGGLEDRLAHIDGHLCHV